MKIGLFSDSHYSSQTVTCGVRYNSRSLEKIRLAYDRFRTEGCGLAVCLGDLIDREEDHGREIENLTRVAAVIRGSGVPTVCVMGNHDAFAFSPDEFYGVLGGCRPRTLRAGAAALVFLDACWSESGRRYAPGDGDWTDTWFPGEAGLERELAGISGEAILFVHQNVDPEISEDHRVANAAAIRRIAERSGIVRTVYQGHYHPGHRSVCGGIRYVTLPAMCEREDAVFVVET